MTAAAGRYLAAPSAGVLPAAWAAAKKPPAALKAIIALCCSDDRYADDVHYFGGNLLTEDGMWSSFILGLGALPLKGGREHIGQH